jgi:hypothetical protein
MKISQAAKIWIDYHVTNSKKFFFQGDPFLEITLFSKGYNLSISRFLAS